MIWYVAAGRRGRRRAAGRTGCRRTQSALECGARRHRVRLPALSGDGDPAHRPAGRMPGRDHRAAPAVPPGAGLRRCSRWWWRRRCCGGGASPRSDASGTPGSSWFLARRGSPAAPTGCLPHPNYVAVIVEGFALPLVHSAWITAVVFTVLNAALLKTRLEVENSALARLR